MMAHLSQTYTLVSQLNNEDIKIVTNMKQKEKHLDDMYHKNAHINNKGRFYE